MARSPRASPAARASNVESTPPENATATLSIPVRISRSLAYLASLTGDSSWRQPDQVLEPGVPLRDLGFGQPNQAVEREILDGEGGHDRAVDDGPAHGAGVGAIVGRQPAHEPTGERVPGPRRVEHALEGIGGDD